MSIRHATKEHTMKNVDIKVKGNIVTITLDTTQDHGPSASGKTNCVATTSGNLPIPGTDVILGLNAYRKRVG